MLIGWIDDLAVEQVDTDGDGSLDKTLYPITDMLGSVQLLTDDVGKIVERIEYDPDGTPHFFSADTQSPAVTRVLWTGAGTLPTGGSIQAHAFELGLSEAMDPASMTNATATLALEGGSAVDLNVTLGPDGRSAILTGASVAAGTNYALHFEGLRDTSGNLLQPEDRMLNVADPESFEVIADTSAPVLLAVMDGNDGIYLLFDEVVQSAGGALASAVEIKRQGTLVEGETERVAPRVLKWYSTSTDLGGGFLLPGAQYSLGVVGVEDLAGNPADASGMSFTHLAGSEGQLLIARQAPTDSYPMAESAYGLTTLFQGRTWHSDLGMYYYRARWYLPGMGAFLERDPFEYIRQLNLYSFVASNPINFRDPLGLAESDTDDELERVLKGEDVARTILSKVNRDVAVIDKSWDATIAEIRNAGEDSGADGPDSESDSWKSLGIVSGLAHSLISVASSVNGTDSALRAVIGFAEEDGFSAGVAANAQIAWPEVGAAASVNVQLFFNKNKWYVGVFGTETRSNWTKRKEQHPGPVRRSLAPVGAARAGIGAAPISVNVANARDGVANFPENWAGYFSSVNASFGAVGVSVFWTGGTYKTPFFAPMRGVEVGVGPGVGATYLHSYYHEWNLSGAISDAQSALACAAIWTTTLGIR